MNLSGILTALGVTKALQLLPGRSASYTTTVDTAETFTGKVVLQRSLDGGQSWQALVTLDGSSVALTEVTGTTSGTIVNETGQRAHYRFQVLTATGADEMDYTLADLVGVELRIVARDGTTVATINDDGTMTITSITNLGTLLRTVLNALPTSEPATVGDLYVNSGVVTVGNGP